MTSETERWAVSQVPAFQERSNIGGRLHTKMIDFDLDKGADGHLGKIHIYDRDSEEAERLAVIIVAALNAAEALT